MTGHVPSPSGARCDPTFTLTAPPSLTRTSPHAECNTTTATFVERSTYDQIWYYSTLLSRIEEQKPNKKVSASDVQACWNNVRRPDGLLLYFLCRIREQPPWVG